MNKPKNAHQYISPPALPSTALDATHGQRYPIAIAVAPAFAIAAASPPCCFSAFAAVQL